MSQDEEFKHIPWQLLSRTTLLHCPPWTEVYVDKVQLPDGIIVEDYYGIDLSNFVSIFAVTRQNKILTQRCYRHAVGKVVLQMPGGG